MNWSGCGDLALILKVIAGLKLQFSNIALVCTIFHEPVSCLDVSLRLDNELIRLR